jgi:glycosyltransferase involved in cell wall biosynthesis
MGGGLSTAKDDGGVTVGSMRGPVKALKQLRIILFFTHGVSLRQWEEIGILDRELALYKSLRVHIRGTLFVTYGGLSDLRYLGRNHGIAVISNPFRLPMSLHARVVSQLVAMFFGRAAVFKSNQILGAEIPLEMARRHGRKFIARCGYLHSDFTERRFGPDSPEAARARALEGKVFSSADRAVVTTQVMKEEVVRRYSVPPGRVHVIPNYVDTELFQPAKPDAERPGRICFVGRLEGQKNLGSLLEAVEGLKVELVLVGSGRLGGALAEEARKRGISARFLGNIPHRRLPGILNQAAIFVLPSHYEGHPKALLEAMACGRACIGTDVPGTRELIQQGENGILCGTSPSEIRHAVQGLLGDKALRTRIGARAREFVVENFSLSKVVDLELRLLEGLAAEMRPG